MRAMPDDSVDSIVTDPPYELGFMGKAWDASGIANSVEMWREALRVLKPGGHLLAFSGSRTYHRMTCAIEDAGFDVRDQIMWVYGSGFPKSQNVSLAIDKKAGAVGHLAKSFNMKGGGERTAEFYGNGRDLSIRHTPATEAARQWEGWGTALKPAHEPICVARKPLIGTVAANVLAHGTGALNIDGCRVASTDGQLAEKYASVQNAGARANSVYGSDSRDRAGSAPHDAGRWPANIIHDGSAEVVALFPAQAGGGDKRGHGGGSREGGFVDTGAGNGDGKPGGALYADAGSAARFFYCAKASRADRNEGCSSSSTPAVATDATMREREDADWPARNGNHHPTVKPTDLMAYLVRLVTPPGGVVLDPFMGSGSTGKACVREGFQFIGCELSAEYVAIAEARISNELIGDLI